MWRDDLELRKKELRAKIDDIDREIIRLIAWRMQHCEEIGEIKARQGSDVYAQGREQEVFVTRRKWGEDYGLRFKFVRVMFKVIMYESKRRQRELVKA